eukprot:322989-Amorphochlora_amoeboformis.AAC.2
MSLTYKRIVEGEYESECYAERCFSNIHVDPRKRISETCGGPLPRKYSKLRDGIPFSVSMGIQKGERGVWRDYDHY